MDAPGAECVGDTGNLLEVIRIEELWGGIDVVDVEAINAHRCKQAAVFCDWPQVFANAAAFEENAAASIAALYGAVGIVPFVNPADRERRYFMNVDWINQLALPESSD